MLLMSVFGGVALLLAAIGIYGLMAYSVEQRTQEIGIRMALGAERGDVRGMVMRQGITFAVIGVVVGLCGAFALAKQISSFLFGVTAWDPVRICDDSYRFADRRGHRDLVAGSPRYASRPGDRVARKLAFTWIHVSTE